MNDRLSADLASLRISRDAPAAPRRAWGKAVLVAALAVGVAAGGVALGAPYVEGKLFKTQVELTEVALVSPAQASVDLAATGYVVPQVVAKVGAKVAGRISKVNIREGDKVKTGDVLFELDPSDQKSAVTSGQARAAAAKARAAAARARAEVARANLVETKLQWDREKILAEKGASARATAEDLGAKVKSLDEQVKAADVEARAAGADATASDAEVSALNITLGNTTIVAPIDGTAVAKPSERGDVVTPASELVELADFDTLLIEADVPEARLGVIKRGSPCEVVFDAYPSKRRRGEVVEVSPRLNRAKASGVVKVKLVDAFDGALPEMAARVSFLQKALDAAQMNEPPKNVIPKSAVAERGGGKVAFTVENGKARAVALTLGPAFGDGYEIVSGPAPGARVIKNPRRRSSTARR